MSTKPTKATQVITETFEVPKEAKQLKPKSAKPDRDPDVAHVQFHTGVDAMGSSLSVSNRQADMFLDWAGVYIFGKTKNNSKKKFFIPFTNIRGVTLL